MTALAFVNSAKPLISALMFFALLIFVILITGVELIYPSVSVEDAFPLIIISFAIALGSMIALGSIAIAA